MIASVQLAPVSVALKFGFLAVLYLFLMWVAVSSLLDMRRGPPHAVDPTSALFDVPPLLKAYLRFGGFIGDGAVIDEQFRTTDVCIIVKTDLITDKYAKHYQLGREAQAPTSDVDV